MAGEQASVNFDSCKNGYIPDGSSAYILSRLDGELGTFLALTGYRLKNTDLVFTKLARKQTVDTQAIIRNLGIGFVGRDINQSYNAYWKTYDQIHAEYMKTKENRNNINMFLDTENQQKLDMLNKNQVTGYPWEPDYNTGYKNNSVIGGHLLKPLNKDRFNYREFQDRHYTNSGKGFEDEFFSTLQAQETHSYSLATQLKDINRLFRFSTVKEIAENLKKENTPFAEFCLKKIENRSPIALECTLRLLRNASKLSYSEVIRQELTVAKNIITRSKDFQIAMENKEKKMKYSKNLSQVTKEEIDSYFCEKTAGLDNFKLAMKPSSLLPTNEYISNYPDCFRLWINEYPTANISARKYFDYEIKNYMIQTL
jgi:enoyl-CoA hydratase/carnithine racemase